MAVVLMWNNDRTEKTDMLLPVSELYTCYLLKPVGSVFKYTQLCSLCLLNDHNSRWQKFNKMSEIFLRDYGPY